jgi:hypothetical protein
MLKHLFPLFWAQKLSNIGTVGTWMGARLMGLCSSYLQGKSWSAVGQADRCCITPWGNDPNACIAHTLTKALYTCMHLRSGVLGGRKSGCQALDKARHSCTRLSRQYALQITFSLGPVQIVNFLFSIDALITEISSIGHKKLTICTLPFIACPWFALSASFANVNKALFK